jgi:hypothetical protein
MQKAQRSRLLEPYDDAVPAPRPAGQGCEARQPRWGDLGLLLILVGLATGIRIWLLTHTEVAARDSIGFIRYALQLENLPWPQVFRESQQHPGYPLAVLLVSWPVRFFMGGTDALSMQLSAQIASSLAGILLVLPMYYLGRELFDRSAGFWGAALIQCLPIPSRILSDGLSEATFLLFITTSLLLAVRGMRTRSVGVFALCGLFGGLAYLTRPEGVSILVAGGLVLLGVQAVPHWRRPWRNVLACGAAMGLTALIVGSPYFLVTGAFTIKPTPSMILEHPWPEARKVKPPHRSHSRAEEPQASAATTDRPATAALLALYAPEDLADRRWWGLQAIATECAKDYVYLPVIPVLLGLWWFRGRMRVLPGAWVALALCLIHTLVLWRLAVVVGYVSERHVVLLVLCGAFTGAATVAAFADWLARLVTRLRAGQSPTRSDRQPHAHWLRLVLLGSFAFFGLPDVLRPMHVNRAGHRAAGVWLAEHAAPYDPILDPFCWAHFYAGRVFTEGQTPAVPDGCSATYFVVLESSDHEHVRLPTIENATKLAALGTVVYYWPENKPEAEAKVRIYGVPLPPGWQAP